MGLVSGGVAEGEAPGGPILYCCPDDLERGYHGNISAATSVRCLGGSVCERRQSPLTPEQREIAEGKRLEIIARAPSLPGEREY